MPAPSPPLRPRREERAERRREQREVNIFFYYCICLNTSLINEINKSYFRRKGTSWAPSVEDIVWALCALGASAASLLRLLDVEIGARALGAHKVASVKATYSGSLDSSRVG